MRKNKGLAIGFGIAAAAVWGAASLQATPAIAADQMTSIVADTIPQDTTAKPDTVTKPDTVAKPDTTQPDTTESSN